MGRPMKKSTKILIKYYFPGLLFSADADEEIKEKRVPKKLPKNCFAFKFGQQEIVEDGKDTFTKPAKWDEELYVIGKEVQLSEIPDIPENSILRSNIRCNSPYKAAIKTHLGNWQALEKRSVVVPVEKFEFESRWV